MYSRPAGERVRGFMVPLFFSLANGFGNLDATGPLEIAHIERILGAAIARMLAKALRS